MCPCAHTYAYTHTYIHTHIHTHIHTYIHTHTYVYTYTCIHIHIHTETCQLIYKSLSRVILYIELATENGMNKDCTAFLYCRVLIFTGF